MQISNIETTAGDLRRLGYFIDASVPDRATTRVRVINGKITLTRADLQNLKFSWDVHFTPTKVEGRIDLTEMSQQYADMLKTKGN